MNRRFPQDCTIECPHFHCWDMSIDDYTCVCDALKMQVDECDMDFIWYSCPLPDQKKKPMVWNDDPWDDRPTEKQEEYAKYLADRMCAELPSEYTKAAYSSFINHWKPIVKEEDDGMNEPSAWQMAYY